MIRYFARQALLVRAGNRGQAAVLFLVVAGTILTVALSSVYLHHLAVARVTSADAVDAIALSAATWEARGLNLIAALNDGATQCFRVIRWICVVWAALAIAAAFGVGLPAFAEYTRQARRLIASYWKTARQLVAWSEKIRKATPYLVLGETAALARKRGVVGVLSPMNPAGPHDGKGTLELHLEPGPPIRLAEAMAPISGALKRIRKIRILKGAARTVIALLDTALSGITGSSEGPIRMLIPENDFQDRQRVRFAGVQPVPELPIPFLGTTGTPRVFAEAAGQPYGGGSVEMTWRSRLIEGAP